MNYVIVSMFNAVDDIKSQKIHYTQKQKKKTKTHKHYHNISYKFKKTILTNLNLFEF